VSSSDFRDTLEELIDTSPEPMDHPSPDEWIAYQRGELPAGEEEHLQEHLVRCRECFDLAEAAAAFAQSHEEPGADQEVETAALWRLLRPQLDPSLQNVREISSVPRRSSWRFRLPDYLAASFFVALVGLTVWNLRLHSANEALRAPKPNVLISEFSVGERAAKPLGFTEALSAQTGLLVLHPSEELPVYRLALRDAATGKPLWSYELRPDKNLALTLQLPEGLRPGDYRLELSDGSSGRAGKVIETHRLRVTETGRGE
jgi:hypothetical protein